MKQQIRKNIFETNSSSVHSIVIKYDGHYVCKLKRDKNNSFAVVGQCHDYSDYGRKTPVMLTTQQEKFDYVISLLCYANEYSASYESIKESWQYSTLLEALKMVDKQIDDIIILDENKVGFDHQTAPYSYNDTVVNFYNEYDIIDFIFNDNIQLKCCFD